MRNSHAMRSYIQGSVIVTILFVASSFPIWQGISALQEGNANESLGYTSLYSAWMYFRKYALPTGNQNESSMGNDFGQETSNRSLILQEDSNDTRLDPTDIDAEDISEGEDVLTPHLVAEELKVLSPVQVADYPLHELSSDNIIQTLDLLSDMDIQKVLGNTKPENLQIVFSKIPGTLHESILNRLDPSMKI
jgi:hypothetical protein